MKKTFVIAAVGLGAMLAAGGWALAEIEGRVPGAMRHMGAGFGTGGDREAGDGMRHGMRSQDSDRHGMRGHGMGGHGRHGHGAGRQGMRGQDGDGQGMRGRHGMGGHGMRGHGGHGMREHGMGGHRMGGPGMRHGETGFGDRGAALADPARLDTIKSELGITPAQETAWTRYAEAVRAAAQVREDHAKTDRDAVRAMSPADRFELVTKMREQASEAGEAVRSASDALIATLDSTQQVKAREVLARDFLPGLESGGGPRRAEGPRGGRHRH